MMRSIQKILAYRGPSLWSLTPVIAIDLGRDMDGQVLSDTAIETLGCLLRDTRPPATDTPLEPLDPPDSSSLVAWAGWLSVNLQRLVSVPVEQSFHRSSHFAFEYRHERVGRQAARIALRAIDAQFDADGPSLDLPRELKRLATLNAAYDHGSVGRAFAAAARRRGIPLSTIDRRGRIIELGTGRYRRRILGTTTSDTSRLASIIADDKLLTNRFLAEAGFPVPLAFRARSVEQAVERARTIGFPVVLKPLDLADSQLVFVDIRDQDELRKRYASLMFGLVTPTEQVLVERFIPGNIYRALVVGGQVVGVFQRVPAHVIGDGASSIHALVERENDDTRSRRTELLPIQIDDAALLTLARQELTLDSIPEAGRRVELKPQIGHRRDGGLARDCTDELHPRNAQLLIQATRVVGLDVAGIDFVTTDCARPLAADGGAIIEINGSPDFARHLHPSEGTPRDGAAALIDHLFPPGQPVRIPVVAVYGEHAAPVVERLGQRLSARGLAVAVAATGRLWVDGLQLENADSSYAAVRRALDHPMVELAIVEVVPHETVAFGLPFDCCDLAVICAGASTGADDELSPERLLRAVARSHIELGSTATDERLEAIAEAAFRQVSERQPGRRFTSVRSDAPSEP